MKISNIHNFVHDNISEYLGFDIDELLYGTDAKVFGGAVRDSIAKLKNNNDVILNEITGMNFNINDVDIIGLGNSIRKVENKLLDMGFNILKPCLDTGLIYVECNKIIHEPITLVKNNIKIQLITPTVGYNNVELPEKILLNIVNNVDIRCCGVYYQNGVVYETIQHAICDCFYLNIYKNITSEMVTSRYHIRINNLMCRGWKEEIDPNTIKENIRNFNLAYILDEEIN